MTNYREILRLDSLSLNKTQIADAFEPFIWGSVSHKNVRQCCIENGVKHLEKCGKVES